VNLLLLNDDDHVEGQAYSVSGRRLQHLLQVHGAGAGDTLRAGVLGGMMGEAQIREIDERRALLSVSLDTPPPQKLPLCLVLALPRPKMLRRILRTAAELGVPELHLINSYRVEKSYWQTPVLGVPGAGTGTVPGYRVAGSPLPPPFQALRGRRILRDDRRMPRPARPPWRLPRLPEGGGGAYPAGDWAGGGI
jgi:hypothetical protein